MVAISVFMRINRAIGLLIFLLIAQFFFRGVIASFSQASNAVFGTVEAAAIRAQQNVK
jgi:hypothetical protein